ncbi:MAG: hypothetical protein HY675_29195 [Chloroflexi bacterium]|nr:hypothetical protein [Chloroflexota bacterium]
MRRHLRPVMTEMAALTCAAILVFVALVWATEVGQAEGPTRPSPAQAAPPARYGHAVVQLGDFVYLFGGVGEGGVLLNDLWRFGPVSATSNQAQGYVRPLDEWAEITPANKPTARFGHTLVEMGGNYVILFGGQGEGGNALDDISSYNPSANNWTPLLSQGTPKPTPRYSHQAVSINDKMYVLGGLGSSGLTQGWLWGYNPGTGTWSQESFSPVGSPYDFSAANIGGQMVIWGGRGSEGTYLSMTWRYNPTTNWWTQLLITTTQQAGSSYPIPGLQPMAATLPARTANQATASQGNRMWVLGGQTQASSAVDNVWEFVFDNSAAVTANALEPLAASRTQAAAVALPQSGGQSAFTRLLVFGGRRSGQALAEPVSYTAWSSPRRLFLPVITRN